MSANGQFHSPGASDWVEQIRTVLSQEPPLLDEAVLEAAYDASEVDSATMFDYFEGRLSEEDRLEVEAEVAASPHALRKLTRIGAIVAQSRGGGLPVAGRAGDSLAKPQSPLPQVSRSARALSIGQRVVHRIQLGPPRSAIGNALPRSEDCLRISPDSPCEFFRSLEKNRDQLRIFHQSAPVGTLVGIRFLEPHADGDPAPALPTQFAVLRRGSDTTTTTTLTIPLSFQRGEVVLELMEIPLAELTADDAGGLLHSFEKADAEDPVAVTPLHEPRSAWQLWADEILKTPTNHVAPTVREVAELIADS